MSRGLGFIQSNIGDMLQTGEILTVADVMAVAGPEFDPRNIRRAFKSLHRRGEAVLTIRRGVLAIKKKGQTPPPTTRQAQTPPPTIRQAQTSPPSIRQAQTTAAGCSSGSEITASDPAGTAAGS
jgi:hypothetical protein